MKVILLERIPRLGQIGDEVTVKAGYARNYLLPTAKALRASKENRARFENERSQLEARDLERRTEAEAVAERMNGETIVVIRQAGERGQLYGSVSPRDISESLTASGFTVTRSQVILNTPIKEIGIIEVPIRLHADVTSDVYINVARSEQEATRQARGEDMTALDRDDEDEDVAEASEDEAIADVDEAEVIEQHEEMFEPEVVEEAHETIEAAADEETSEEAASEDEEQK